MAAKKKDLIIVESPAKTRTLSSFLGNGYEVRASMGHVRDLPKSKLGVDPEHDFAPSYTVIPDRRQLIADLKKAAKGAGNVYLASDPDREGEAIAWHLAEVLDAKNVKRIQFHEITKRAVQEALQNPRDINVNRVNAQQARRVLDRLVGYKLSPLLWKKVQKNLSAGRVQSVAVRLVVEREREIEGFITDEYWSLVARLTPRDRSFPFEAKLAQVGGKKAELGGAGSVNEVLRRLGYAAQLNESGGWDAVPSGTAEPGAADWQVGEVRRREQRRNPAPPFITSTLQQEASRKLGFNARRAMQTAQQLYEGVELGSHGHVGLITYMRTDSVNISQEAQEEAREYISRTYGDSFMPPSPRQYKAREGAQEAHEAIRPTSVFRTPDSVREHLTSDQFRLYQLVWLRFLASQMAAAVFDVTSVDIHVLDLLFRATGRVMKFEGFMALYTEGRDDRTQAEKEEDADEGRRLPDLNSSQLLNLLNLLPRQHFTEPPPRFTEATLVRALEEKGIGRPSTYAQIMSVIVDRGYVVLDEKRFRPTDLGCVVNDQLVRHFPEVVSADFTAEIEQHLDDIAGGERGWVDVLQEFYNPFQADLDRAESEMERVKGEAHVTELACPNCGKPMVVRSSRYGKFLGCSGFPECRNLMQPGADPRVAAAIAATATASGETRSKLINLIGLENAERGVQVYERAPATVTDAQSRLGVLSAMLVREARAPAADDESPFADEPSAAPAEEAPESMDCPNCGRPMQKRVGRFGPFWGCTGYPECKTIVDPKKRDQSPPDPEFSMECPRPGCGGTVTAKRSFRGTVFYGCSNYNADPKCEYVAWNRPDPARRCETCSYPMAEKIFRGQSQGWKCTNADCPTNPPKKAKPASRRGGAAASRAKTSAGKRKA